MGKVGPTFLSLLFITCLAMPLMVHGEIGKWFENLHHAKQKLTKLHFYYHDIVSGPNQNSIVVAQATNTFKSPTVFGQVNIFDDPLTLQPDPTSELVGRAQGLYGFASQEDISLLMAMNFVFTSGKHNGSSLTILGRNPAAHSVRELPVISGTGVFRLARGFALVKTYFINVTVAIVEYNVAVLHY